MLHNLGALRGQGLNVVPKKDKKSAIAKHCLDEDQVVMAQTSLVFWGTSQVGSQYDHPACRIVALSELPKTLMEWQMRTLTPLPQKSHPQPHFGGYEYDPSNKRNTPVVNTDLNLDKKWKLPAGTPVFPGRPASPIFGFEKSIVVNDVAQDAEKKIQTSGSAPANAKKAKKDKRTEGEPEVEPKQESRIENPWSIAGRAQFDMLYPSADCGFSWWYVMCYEAQQNGVLANEVRNAYEAIPQTKVICIVCWVQQFCEQWGSGLVAWTRPVDRYVELDPNVLQAIEQMEHDAQDDDDEDW